MSDKIFIKMKDVLALLPNDDSTCNLIMNLPTIVLTDIKEEDKV